AVRRRRTRADPAGCLVRKYDESSPKLGIASSQMGHPHLVWGRVGGASGGLMHGNRFAHARKPGQGTSASTVLIVDDHVVFAQLVRRALSHEPDLTCVGIASSLTEARQMFAATKPDVVIMDVRLQDGDGIDATAELVAVDPQVRVVVLSAYI